MNLILKELLKQSFYIATKLKGLPAQALDALRNPGKDPRFTAIVVVLALVLLLLLHSFIELLMALLFPERKSARKSAPDDGTGRSAVEVGAGREPPLAPAMEATVKIVKDRKVRRPLTLAERIGVTAFILISILAAALYGTSQPRFCSSCHEMSNANSTWKESTHKTVGCLVCHQKPGMFGFAMGKVDLLRMTVAKATGKYERPIKATLEEGGCAKCHKTTYTQKVVSNSIRVSHTDFLKVGYRCGDCHGTIAHGKTPGATYPTMEKCANCHNGKRAKADCAICHVVDAGVVVRRPVEEYPKVTLASGSCKSCHRIEKCTACHGVEMPHPPGWTERATHAKAAAFEKKEVCTKCHDSGFCARCHGFPGHPADWKGLHKVDRSYEKQCMACHTPEKSPVFCALCHDDREKRDVPEAKQTVGP